MTVTVKGLKRGQAACSQCLRAQRWERSMRRHGH